MSRPRRRVQPKKYVVEESDEEILKEPEKNANSITEEQPTLPNEPEILDSQPLLASVPTESQILHTRVLMERQAAEVSLLLAECQERKTAWEESEAKLRAAQQALFETKAIIAPIKRVPTEVLGLIFIAHVRENQQSPWTLMQVSRTWRSTAIMTRSLWGGILLAHKRWAKARGVSRQTRFIDGMEICSKQEQFTLALKRAGAAPLDLKVITAGITNLVYPFDKQVAKPRVRSLDLTTDHDWDLFSGVFNEFDFSDLESLTLVDDLTTVAEKVVKEARRLLSLDVPVITLSKMTEGKWWNELEKLTITFCVAEEVDWLKPTLIGATNLTSLSLEDVELDASFTQAPICVPSLKRLKLFDVAPFWPIDCPNLQYLLLEEPLSCGGLADRSIRLPQLVEMVFISLGFGTMLRVFDLPSLTNFNFQGGGGKAANASLFRFLWPTTGSTTGTNDPVFKIQPTILSFQGVEINSKVLSRTIACHTSLEDFSTIAVDITADFFDGLVPVQVEIRPKKSQASQHRAASTWQVGAPALKRLSVDFVGRKTKKDKVALEAGAKTLIATRIRAGAPLERLAMRFTEVEGWKELVESGVMA